MRNQHIDVISTVQKIFDLFFASVMDDVELHNKVSLVILRGGIHWPTKLLYKRLNLEKIWKAI